MLADILVEYGLKIYIFISALRNISLIHLPNISINGKLKKTRNCQKQIHNYSSACLTKLYIFRNVCRSKFKFLSFL